MKKRIKKWWFWLILAVLYLVVVHIMFSIPAPFKWMEAVWSAGDFITFVGTTVLGYVAISQTEKTNQMAERANEMSERLMELEKDRYKLELRPFIMPISWKVCELDFHKILFTEDNVLCIQIGKYEDGETALGLELKLQNTTNSFATAMYHTAYSENINWSNSAVNQSVNKLALPANESAKIAFYASPDYMKSLSGERFTIEFILENRIAERYKESFDLILMGLSDRSLHKEKEWFCNVYVQDYKIGKFKKNQDGDTELIMEEI